MEYFKLQARGGRRYETLHRWGGQKNQTACGIIVGPMFGEVRVTSIYYVTADQAGHKLCSSTCFRPVWYDYLNYGTENKTD